MTKELEEIQTMRLNLEHAEDQYLRDKGWNYTTCKLNCCWYWEKEHNGKILMLNRDEALSLQEYIDEGN